MTADQAEGKAIEEIQKLGQELYTNNFKIWDFGFEKDPGFNDRK